MGCRGKALEGERGRGGLYRYHLTVKALKLYSNMRERDMPNNSR